MKRDILRRCIAETIGTFALVFVGCGTRIMIGDTKDFAGNLVVHLAFGLTVAAMIYALSYLSSAHFNPAITLGFAISRRFPWKLVVPFWIAQCIGGLGASFLHFLLFSDKASQAHYGATIPKVGLLPGLVVEIVLSFFLMYVSMASATDKRFKRTDSGLTVGFTIVASGLFGNSLSGASMNPIRSLAPALFAGMSALSSIWLYLLGPAIGAMLGAFIYEIIRGNEENAKPVLDDYPMPGTTPIPHLASEQKTSKAS